MPELLLNPQSDLPVFLREIIESIVLLEVVWVHKAVLFIDHVLLTVPSALEDLVAAETLFLDLDKLPKILQQPLFVDTRLGIDDEEAKLLLHVLKIFLDCFEVSVGEQADSLVYIRRVDRTRRDHLYYLAFDGNLGGDDDVGLLFLLFLIELNLQQLELLGVHVVLVGGLGLEFLFGDLAKILVYDLPGHGSDADLCAFGP